jgi:anti-anti-sigma factor
MNGPGRFSCRIEHRDGGAHLIAEGELDFRTRHAFGDAVRALLATKPGTAVLDLTAVSFLSSEGISELVQAHHRAAELGSTLLITPSPFLLRRLDVFGLTDILALAPDTRSKPGQPDGPTASETATGAPTPE